MFLFVLVFLVLHSSVNFYIGYRGFQALEFFPVAKPFFVTFIVVMTIAYPLSAILERKFYNSLITILHWAGSFWFAFMLYVTLMLLVVDLFRVVNSIYPFFHHLSVSVVKLKQWTFILTSLVVILIILSGYINASIPKIIELELEVNKDGGEQKEINIAAVSDIHLGKIVRNRKAKRLINKITMLNPDVVLLAGDIIDNDAKSVEKLDLGRFFKDLDIPMGIYAVTGNHEYIGDAECAVSYLSKNGITFIRDSAININNNFYVVGREDRQRKHIVNEERKSLEELLESLDVLKPIILLDHQPYNLSDVAKYPVDIQISGHTHNGQMWPLSFVTQKVFEVSKGYKKIKNTHFYVSSGYGTWGPPIKIGNNSEIVSIKLIFK